MYRTVSMNGVSEDLISVIVPVYKVEKYLDRCVESIVGQTYENLEIILVDDGSPDSCGAMCDAWAQRDSRIKVVHKKNGGLSDARNAGVEASTGAWIGFIDSDDYIAPDMYERLHDLVKDPDVGIAICGVADVYSNHTEEPPVVQTSIMTSEEVLSDIFLNKTLMVGVPPRLYPAWLMCEVTSPVCKSHEDAFIVVDLFSRVERVAVDTTPRYFYCHNEETITSSPSTRGLSDNVDAWERNRRLVEQLYPNLIDDVMFRCYWAHFDVLDGLMLSNRSADDEARMNAVIAWLKDHRAGVYAHPHVSSKRKLALRALCLNKGLYRMLAKLQNRSIKYN